MASTPAVSTCSHAEQIELDAFGRRRMAPCHGCQTLVEPPSGSNFLPNGWWKTPVGGPFTGFHNPDTGCVLCTKCYKKSEATD